MQSGSLKQLLRIIATMLFIGFSSAVARAECSFSVSDLDFGTVNLVGGGAAAGTASVNVSCTNRDILSLTYRICINLNAGGGGSTGGTRHMKSGTNVLNYQLYQDMGYATPWGSTDNASLGSPMQLNLLVLPGLTATLQRTIYGRILPSQGLAKGGPYTSSFAGAATSFNYAALALLPANCTTVTQNPTQAPFTVRTTVDRTCMISALPIDFGTHGVLGTALNAQGGLSINCTTGLPYTVSLDNGVTGTGPGQRRMTQGSSAIIYGLYMNQARTQLWGSGTGQTASGTGTGLTQALPVYARLEAQTTPAAGVYKDTVVVTISY